MNSNWTDYASRYNQTAYDNGAINTMNRMKGLTIIQLMVLLLVAGIVGTILVNVIIEKRCESNPSLKICLERKAGRSK